MNYRNFNVALFCTSAGTERIARDESFRDTIPYLERHIGYDKVYIETFRAFDPDGEKMQLEDFIVGKDEIEYTIDYFRKKSKKTSGALATFDVYSPGDTGFRSLCYSNEKHLRLLERVTAYTAGFFDEIIIDDFYFTNCKCGLCIEQKGKNTWQEFRLERMRYVSEHVIKRAALAANPRARLVIKYPNWYEQYQATGYDLEKEPVIFDGMYAGAETRDAEYTHQNLQKYSGYFIMRYLDSVRPGKNRGGWLDAFDCRHNVSDYTMQLLFLLFAKPEEITFFSLDLLLETQQLFIPITGRILEEFDSLIDRLGNPAGVPCYKPMHSAGENYIHDYLGSLGFPFAPSIYFPDTNRLVFLTESAAADKNIIDKMKGHLRKGSDILMTSGLLKALQDDGMEQITGIRVSDKKAIVEKYAHTRFETSYSRYIDCARSILFPQVEYPENEAYPLIAGFCDFNSYPILLKDRYGDGNLYVLTVPENLGDLYNLPVEITDKIKQTVLFDETVRVEDAGRIALFSYDNSVFIAASLLPHNTRVKVIVNGEGARLIDISRNRELQGTTDGKSTVFTVTLMPAEYIVYEYIV